MRLEWCAAPAVYAQQPARNTASCPACLPLPASPARLCAVLAHIPLLQVKLAAQVAQGNLQGGGKVMGRSEQAAASACSPFSRRPLLPAQPLPQPSALLSQNIKRLSSRDCDITEEHSSGAPRRDRAA